jgi:signal transduction histidine kinase
MKLRTQTTIAVTVVSLIIFLLLHVVAVTLIMPGFMSVDDQDTTQDLSKAKGLINYRTSQLERTNRDYAWWDDTYYFVQNHNLQYVQSNFVDQTFQNLHINLVVILDKNSNILYAKILDHNLNSSVQESISKKLSSDSQRWNLTNEQSTTSGLLLINNQPMMIAAAPILNSERQGPAEGTLIFGTDLDSSEVSSLESISNLIFSINLINDQQDTNKIIEPLLISPQVPILKENNDTSISGYTVLNDLNANPTFILQVDRPRIAYTQGLWVENVFLACSIVICLTFWVAIILFLERRIIKPMNKLSSTVQDIPFKQQQPHKGQFQPDEIDVLSNAVSKTINNKMDAMLEVSRMVAHDLRNPLAGIKNANYVLKRNYGNTFDDKGKLMLTTIDDCVNYSDKIVQDLLDYSTKIKLDKVKTSVKELINNSLQPFLLSSNIEITVDISDNLYTFVDPERVKRVFTNLIKNAIDAMPTNGKLSITAKKVGNSIAIQFTDNGIGMSKETLEKLWQPFFTTKAKGMGIGLPICKRIIEAHDGRIEVKSTLNLGTTFEVYLPL